MVGIVNNRIAGTRVTIWDVVHYLERGRSRDEIARILGISGDQVESATDFIRDHRDEVLAVHRRIEERNARGNAPEIEVKLVESRAKRRAVMAQRREASCHGGNGEGNHR